MLKFSDSTPLNHPAFLSEFANGGKGIGSRALRTCEYEGLCLRPQADVVAGSGCAACEDGQAAGSEQVRDRAQVRHDARECHQLSEARQVGA